MVGVLPKHCDCDCAAADKFCINVVSSLHLWLHLTFCPAGHLACVKLLLEEGADIEQRNVVSCTSGRLWVLTKCYIAAIDAMYRM